MAEDPAVHEQSEESDQLVRSRVVMLAAHASEVLHQLVMCRVRSPAVVADRPGEVHNGVALGRESPVEEDEAVGGQSDLLVADVGVDERCSKRLDCSDERLGVLVQAEYALGDVEVDGLGEGLPEDLVLLGQQVEAGALRLGDGG